MNLKSLIAVVVCSVLVASLIFVSYQVGYNNGSTVSDINQMNNINEYYPRGWADGNKTGYEEGFIAGLQSAGVSMHPDRPTPIPSEFQVQNITG